MKNLYLKYCFIVVLMTSVKCLNAQGISGPTYVCKGSSATYSMDGDLEYPHYRSGWCVEGYNSREFVCSGCSNSGGSQSMTYQFDETGTYTVTIVAVNEDDYNHYGAAVTCSSEEVVEITVTVYEPPEDVGDRILISEGPIVADPIADIEFTNDLTEQGVSDWKVYHDGDLIGQAGAFNGVVTHGSSEPGINEYEVFVKYNDCDFVGPFLKSVEVTSACPELSMEVDGIDSEEGGYLLVKDATYKINVIGDPAGREYEIVHDGGSDIELTDDEFTVLNGLGRYTFSFEIEDTGSCDGLESMEVFLGGTNLTIEDPDNCLVVLPDILSNYGYDVENDPEGVVLEHFSATVRSDKGVVVKPGLTLSMGAELILEYEEPTIDDSELDPNMNFIQTTSYDEYGRIIGDSRQYFDNSGRGTQVQVKNLNEDVIITSQVVNDFYGRPVLSTLPAPSKVGTFEVVEDGCGDRVQTGARVKFEYKQNFINGTSNQPYDYTKFDLSLEYSPEPVLNSEEGTLGWYYSVNNGTSTSDVLNEPNTPHTAYPYTRTLYHDDGTESVKGVAGPGNVFRAGSDHVAESNMTSIDSEDPFINNYLDIRQTELNLSYPSSFENEENFFKSVSTDEMGKLSWTYKDKEENVIMSLYFGNQSDPILMSYNFYNNMGQLVVSISPNGLEQYNNGVDFKDIDKSENHYDFQGRLLATEEPDAGRTEFMYRKDGSIRFSQNELQKGSNRFSYTNYDDLGRPVESGELELDDDFIFRDLLESETEGLYDNWLDNLPGTFIKSDWVETAYDSPDENFNSESGLSEHKQQFVRGAVSYTHNENSKTWYSYDERGRVQWVAQNINGLGVKLIEYIYGPTGAVELIAYQRGEDDEFFHFYEYDKDGRLSKVYTAIEEPVYNIQGEIENPDVLKQQAIYDYYLHGPLKRVELADQLQGIDFVYTIKGQLKSINDANPGNDPGEDGLGDSEFKPDVFGMSFDYYNGDHQNGTVINTGVEQFTGNIKSQSWFSPVDGGIQRGYVYDYDPRYQLTNAIFGDITAGTFVSASDAYDVSVVSNSNEPYDLNGNIQGLVRKDDMGANLHDLEYNYIPNKNQLDNVSHEGDPFRSYQYNEIGQMISQRDEIAGFEQTMEYDVSGKVAAVYKQVDGESKVKLSEYAYDDRGFRVSKTIYEDDGTTIADQVWYVRDASGSLIRSYSSDATLDEYPIYGAGRLGMYRPNAIWNDYMYEVSDHLGNVRAVLGKDITVEYLGTFESERETVENDQMVDANGNTGYFGNWANHQIATFNHTPVDITEDDVPLNLNPGNLGGVIRINNDQDVPITPIRATKMIPVSPGDVVSLEVFVKYAQFNSTDESILSGIFTNYVANAFGGLSTGVATDGGAINNIFDQSHNPFFDPQELFTEPDADEPKAYLNYIVFDKDFKVVGSDRSQVTDEGEIPTEEHMLLTMQDIEINDEGFMYIYVSNEDQQNMDVYFDDLRITHTYTNVVAGSDFYPFGLTMESRDINREKYRYGFQGEFAEEDTETGWNSFELRMYDPVIGRWNVVDPFRQHFSPYLSLSNNPISRTDPNGGYDVILHGNNGNTVTIRAPGKHIHINVDYEFSGNQIIDLGLDNLSDLAIGFENAITFNGQFIGGASVSGFRQNVMFFNEEFGGYWYQFIGGQGIGKFGADVDFSVGASGGMFIGVNKSGDFSPSSFAGDYYTGGIDAGPSFFAKVRGYYQFSTSDHWDVHEIGLSVSGGVSGGAASGFAGAGTLKLLNQNIRTQDRSWSDVISNQLIFNPLSPLGQ